MALAAGVQGLMVAAPAYCLPTGPELGEHILQVLRSTGLPTVLYDYPARTGVQFNVDSLDLLAGHPQVVGIKEASGDLTRIAMLHDRYGDDLAIISGSDTLAMHYFESGSDCWIAARSRSGSPMKLAAFRAASRAPRCTACGLPGV